MKKKDPNKSTIERKMETIGKEIFEEEYDPEDLKNELMELDQKILTFREEKFINEYFIDGKEAEAAIRAGYSAWTASSIAKALMKNPKIKKEIDKRREEVRKRYTISHDRVAEEYSKIAFSNIKDYFDEDGNIKDFGEMTDYAAAAMSSVELDNIFIKGKEEDGSDDKIVTKIKKFKLIDKKQTLDSISKLMGFNENSDEKLLEIGLAGLLKMFPKDVQEQLKIAIMDRIQGKLLK